LYGTGICTNSIDVIYVPLELQRRQL